MAIDENENLIPVTANKEKDRGFLGFISNLLSK